MQQTNVFIFSVERRPVAGHNDVKYHTPNVFIIIRKKRPRNNSYTNSE